MVFWADWVLVMTGTRSSIALILLFLINTLSKWYCPVSFPFDSR